MADAMQTLQEVEYLGEEILSDKRNIINLDQQRHKNREALRALSQQKNEKLWISYSNMFVKIKNKQAESMINEDQKVLDESINDIRDQLKVKVNDLRRLEGKPELKGYNLTPLNSKELEAIKNIVPEVVNSDI